MTFIIHNLYDYLKMNNFYFDAIVLWGTKGPQEISEVVVNLRVILMGLKPHRFSLNQVCVALESAG